jgi:hypothetical protein
MKLRHSIFLLIAATMIAMLVACGNDKKQPVISVTLSGAPVSLQTNATAALTASVNDAAGVTWSVTCGSAGACGAFSNTTTTSASYTAPAAVPTGNTVTVTANAVTDTTKSASATITIVTPVTLSGAPASLLINAAAALTASSGDSAGVTWSVTCGSSGAGACGAFSNATTTSATYTAPATIPIGVTVTVTATSVTDTTKSASATITIVTILNTTLADGTYVFSLAGEDSATTAGPYYVAGAFAVSGGSITSGEQDFIDLATIVEDAITGGSVTATTDGNLQITLTTADASVGVSGVETLDAALVSSTRARIIEFDGSATSSGRVDMQTSTGPPSAGYAFFVVGFDGSSPNVFPQTIGGVFNIDGSGTISGTGSVFDINDGGSVQQAQSFAASTVSAPDAFGRVVFSLVPSVASTVPAVNLVGYIVDTTHIRLVETGDPMNGTMGGIALGQGANTGTFSSISGNSYVAGLTGFDGSAAGVLQAAGILTANSNGTVSGAINYNNLSGAGPTTPSPITGGTYTVDSTGRVTMTGLTDGIATFNLQLYLTGQGSEAEETAVTMDATDVLAGLSWQQTGGGSFTAASFYGTYALDATGTDLTNVTELDAVGPITVDGVGTLTGTVDINSLSLGGSTGLPVSSTFTANSNGAFTGTITGLDVTTITNQDVFVYYLIDTKKAFAIETDTNQLTLGFLTLEQ